MRVRLETEFTPFKGQDRMRLDILSATRHTGELAMSFLRSTVTTWEHPVTFSMKSSGGGAVGVRQRQGIAFVEIHTDDEIWHMLDEGTNVRLVGVSSDFEAKTVPDVFGSFPGAGEVYNDGVPRPGIEARRWSLNLPGLVADDFADNVFNAMENWFG